MIISTPHARRRAARGFTLTEVIIASTLSTMLLAGVLSSFLMVGRTGFNAGNYSEMDADLRLGLETFGRDARQASDIRWNSNRSITLTLPTATSATTKVTYAFVPTGVSGTFSRWEGDASSTAEQRVLVRNVSATFAFRRYKLDRPGETDNAATNDLETKQIEVALRASMAGGTSPAASQAAVSARYILRNKRVSN